MDMSNDMENIVKEELDKLLLKKDDVCKCYKCKLDMMILALNRLPPKYIITEKGRIYTKLKEQETQFKVDVVRELTKAIMQVSANPQH